MNDTIYRQAAIEAICDVCQICNKYTCEGRKDGSDWCDEIVALKNLPSTQLELSFEVRDILDYLDTTLHPIISPEHWNVYSELYDMISMLRGEEKCVKQ